MIQNNEYIQSVARCLQMMLRLDEYRFAFVSVDGISTLLSILSSRVNFQVRQQTFQFKIFICNRNLTFHFRSNLGSIPVDFLLVGVDIQPIVGWKDE